MSRKEKTEYSNKVLKDAYLDLVHETVFTSSFLLEKAETSKLLEVV